MTTDNNIYFPFSGMIEIPLTCNTEDGLYHKYVVARIRLCYSENHNKMFIRGISIIKFTKNKVSEIKDTEIMIAGKLKKGYAAAFGNLPMGE